MNEKLSERMREYLFRLSEREPVTMPEVGWPDEVAALEAKLEATERMLAVAKRIAYAAAKDAAPEDWRQKMTKEEIDTILAAAQEEQRE